MAASRQSRFHSQLATARLPGAPVRQPSSSTSSPQLQQPQCAALDEFREQLFAVDLLTEYWQLGVHCPRGVYIVPSTVTSREWQGVIFVHSGLYNGGIFNFTIFVPDGFPKTRPLLKFKSRVHHPKVHATNGVLNMLSGFPSWDPSHHHIWHVVDYLHRCLHSEHLEGESDEMRRMVRECVEESRAAILERQTAPEVGGIIQLVPCAQAIVDKARAHIQCGEYPHPEPIMVTSTPSNTYQL